MNKILISFVAVCGIGTAYAQSSNPSTPPSGTTGESSAANASSQPQSTTFRAGDRHAFDMADTNHDGALTTDEFAKASGNPSGSPTRFSAFDRNGDGRISPDEWANGKDDK